MHLNLLPAEFIRGYNQRRRLHLFAAALVLLLGLLLVWYGQGEWQLAAIRARVVREQAACGDLQALYDETNLRQSQLDAWEVEDAARQKRQAENRTLAIVGLLARCTRDARGNVQWKTLNVRAPSSGAAAPKPVATGGPPGAPAAASAQVGVVSLAAQAENTPAILRLVAALRETNVFKLVELKGATAAAGGEQRNQDFQVECQF